MVWEGWHVDGAEQAVEKLSNLFRNEIEAFYAEFAMCERWCRWAGRGERLSHRPKNTRIALAGERRGSEGNEGTLRSSNSDEFSDCLSPCAPQTTLQLQ